MRLSLLFILALAAPAQAKTDPPDLARAQNLVNAASRHFVEKQYEKALSALTDAEVIAAAAKDPSLASIRFNIARCHEELGQPKKALKAYERYNELPDQPHRKQRAAEAMTKLRASIYGVLGVSCQPIGALVEIDGLLDAPAPCPWTGQEVEPGVYTVKASFDGFESETQQVKVVAGQPAGVTFRLKAKANAPTAIVSPLAKPEPEAETNAWPWVLMGVGVAAIGGGAVFTFSAISNRDEAEDSPPSPQREDAVSAYERDETLSWIGYGAGGALLVGGLIWLLTDEGPPPEESAFRFTGQGVQVRW